MPFSDGVAAAPLALLLLFAVWQSSGPRGVRRDLAGATVRVAEKQREVDAPVRDVIDDAPPEATGEYYVRNRNGECLRVERP